MEQSGLTPFYEWQAGGQSPRIRLSLAVVDRLGSEVQRDDDPSRPRAEEFGGLLLGRLKRIHGSAVVEIEDFEPVVCEHAAGPSYFLSNADRHELARGIRRRKASSGMSIVGFYRSNTRKEFASTMEDIDLMLDYCAKPWMVLLMIEAAPRAPLKAGFFTWEEHRIHCGKPYLEFPFDSTELLAGGYDLYTPPVAGRPAPRTRTAVGRRLPPVSLPVELQRLSRALRQQKWPASMANALRSAAPKTWANLRSRLLHPKWKTISIFLREPRNHTKIAWVAMGAILAGAVAGGVLNRHPAPAPATAPLTARTVRQRKTARLIPSRVEPDVSTPLPLPAVLPESPAITEATAPPARRHDRTPARNARQTGYRERAIAGLASPGAAREAASAAGPLLPDAPEIVAAPKIDPEPLWHESGVLEPTIPRASDPYVRVALDPPASRGGGLLGKLHLARNRRVATGFEPPTLLHEAHVDVPTDLRRRIQHEVTIQVKLYLDRGGKVEYAELLSDGTGANRDVASLAVFSSRRCQFSPARVGDETVPAEVVLRYRFGPAGQ